MERYVALLRGINISGKNKIAMSELKKGLEKLGFTQVVTHLNSGNAAFSTDGEESSLSDKISAMIKSEFGLEIPVFVILQSELRDILANAPEWWGDDGKEIYDNIIFAMPPLKIEEIFAELGELNAEYEKAEGYKNAVFWSFSRADYRKTNWWAKTANSPISGKITIRTANTIRKTAVI